MKKITLDENGIITTSEGKTYYVGVDDFTKELVKRFNAYDQMKITLNEVEMDKMLLRLSVLEECSGWINTIKFALGEDDKAEK